MTSRPRDEHARLTDRLAGWFGSDAGARADLVLGMIRRDGSESASYWFQLVVAVGIATFGLVLGSTAVVIAGMLVAPLMSPILALGMGLAIGSPVLVVRATARVAASVIVTVAGAALITVALPFHDLNAEILARTSPTVLDLLVASCCALAGVYAAVRPSPDASTAAGTSIGISLVPPLCVTGYGLGILDGDVARGAALLFLTNVVAIVVVASIGFLATGFGHLDVAALEAVEGGPTRPGTSAVDRLSRWLGARWVRVAMPLAMLALVWVPLRRGLDEVAWEVRVRRAGQEVIRRLADRVVASQLRADQGTVDARLVVLGSEDDADAAREQLVDALVRAGSVDPHVEVAVVPDTAALRALRRDVAERAPVLPTPPPPPPTEALAERLRALWPEATAGAVRSVQIDAAATPPLLRVVHHGPPLAPDARDVLARALAGDGAPPRLVTVAVPAGPVEPLALDDAGAAAWLTSLAAAEEAGLTICASGLDRRDRSPRFALVKAALAGRPGVVAVPGEGVVVEVVDGACAGER